MPRDLAKLNVGDVVSDRSFAAPADSVERYVDAVGDQSGLYDPSDACPVAPPMAVATFALRGVLDDLGIPEGTLHAGQEMTFHAPLPVGARVRCKAAIAHNAVRTGYRLIAVSMEARDDADRTIVSAKSSILTPA